MGMFSDLLQNKVIDAILRGGAVNAAGTINSSAVIDGVWAATTAYTVGKIVAPPSTFTAGGGKFLMCTTAGTSGSTTTLACPAIGSTLTDGTVTWTAISGMPMSPNLYIALLTNTKGARANSTAYVLNDTIHLTANDSKVHYYKCTTAGTTAASQSTLYPGAANEVITDGTAAFTEQNSALDAGTGIVEATGAGYARVNLSASLANWAGTQSSASTTASSGTGGTSSNNSAITFGSPTADWQPTNGYIWGYAVYDQLTSGNLLFWVAMTTPQKVLNGQSAPSFATSQLTLTIGN